MPYRDDDDALREDRLQHLLLRLPERMQRAVVWLRRPNARRVRIPAGILLICGSVLAILPVFGLWMLPLGVVLLSEDVPFLKRLSARCLGWIDRKHPSWLGVAPAVVPGAARRALRQPGQQTAPSSTHDHGVRS